MNTEAQLLVNIDADLKKEVQKKAIDNDISLKILVSEALKNYLSEEDKLEEF